MMNKRIITETQGLRDLRHLAAEIATSLKSSTPTAASARQAAELAETAWTLLRAHGPVKSEGNGYTLAIRATAPGQVELLGWDEVEGGQPRRSANVLEPSAWALWLHLETSEYCPERLYSDLTKLTELAEARREGNHLRAEAEQRWAEAEQQLLVEGLLPVRVLAPPSNAGGARYEFEVLIGDEFVAALRETLAWWGAYIIAHRPDINHLGQRLDATYYTLSVQSVDDQWAIAKMMVLQYYADKPERSQS